VETIKIRHNRKTLIPMLALLTAALLGGLYYSFFYHSTETGTTMKIISGLLSIWLAYAIYRMTGKLLKNDPVLTLSDAEISINDKGKPVSYSWHEVIGWHLEKDRDDTTHYLVIETTGKKRKINISWLEKKPFEIEVLMKEYKKPV
jgi:hypothetical protein